MTKTIKALDTLLSWYIHLIHDYLIWDYNLINDNPWMSYTILPIAGWCIWMIIKYGFLFGILTSPIASIMKTPANILYEIIKDWNEKRIKKS